MSTPATLNTYRVTWVTGADRLGASAHMVQAADWAIEPSADPNIYLAAFKNADSATAFSISTAFVVSVELIAEKG